jgi:hypothetical protein
MRGVEFLMDFTFRVGLKVIEIPKGTVMYITELGQSQYFFKEHPISKYYVETKLLPEKIVKKV